MRIVIAFILIQILLLHSVAVTAESNQQGNNKTYQNKNNGLVMIVNGEIIDHQRENNRSKFLNDLLLFQTIQEKKVAESNQKRLDHYKPRLTSYLPPKGDMSILVTGYSSTPDQTWGDPFITASGTRVHKGTMACPPQYPFGTKVKIQSMGMFVCEDRGGKIHGNHFDMWFTSRAKALNWGKRIVSAEITK